MVFGCVACEDGERGGYGFEGWGGLGGVVGGDGAEGHGGGLFDVLHDEIATLKNLARIGAIADLTGYLFYLPNDSCRAGGRKGDVGSVYAVKAGPDSLIVLFHGGGMQLNAKLS